MEINREFFKVVNENFEHLTQTCKGKKLLKRATSRCFWGIWGNRLESLVLFALLKSTFVDYFDKNKKFCHAHRSFFLF